MEPVNTNNGFVRSAAGILILLITSTLMWTAFTLTNLNTQVAVLINQNQIQFENIDRRITEHVRMPVHGLVKIGGFTGEPNASN